MDSSPRAAHTVRLAGPLSPRAGWQATMDKMSIYEDPAITAKFPRKLESVVDIELQDGRRIHQVIGHAPGHWDNPFTDEQLIEKFRENARGIISPVKADRFIERFINEPRIGEVYNIGGGRENSVSIVEAFAAIEEISREETIAFAKALTAKTSRPVFLSRGQNGIVGVSGGDVPHGRGRVRRPRWRRPHDRPRFHHAPGGGEQE